MDSFHFDDRLFQRGRTWQECLESWDHNRDLFLTRVAEVEPLPKTITALNQVTRPQRLAIIFQTWRLDSLMCLPVIGKTLSQANHLTVRYFDKQAFFSLFYNLGRQVPKLLKLADNGQASFLWGPRPKQVSEQLHELQVSEREAWYTEMKDDLLHSLIDEELSQSVHFE